MGTTISPVQTPPAKGGCGAPPTPGGGPTEAPAAGAPAPGAQPAAPTEGGGGTDHNHVAGASGGGDQAVAGTAELKSLLEQLSALLEKLSGTAGGGPEQHSGCGMDHGAEQTSTQTAGASGDLTQQAQQTIAAAQAAVNAAQGGGAAQQSNTGGQTGQQSTQAGGDSADKNNEKPIFLDHNILFGPAVAPDGRVLFGGFGG